MLADLIAAPEALRRRWLALAVDPDAPDHYELNECGEIILTPRPTNDHQRIVHFVARALTAQIGPEAVCEVSVLTDKGVRVPDVVWMPEESWKQMKGHTPLPRVPDICVEVLSPANTREETSMKIGAYLRGGAKEAIIIERDGSCQFHGVEGERELSAFGVRFELPQDLL
jgi:Uma2 family endonuclease